MYDDDACNGFVHVGSGNEVATVVAALLAFVLALGIVISHGRRRKVWPAVCAMCVVCVRSKGSGNGGGDGGVGVGEGVGVVVVVDEVSVSVSVVVPEGGGSGAMGLSTG